MQTNGKQGRGERLQGRKRAESKWTAWPEEATDLKARKERERNQESARKQREDEAAAAGLNAQRQRDERYSAIERRDREERGCKDEWHTTINFDCPSGIKHYWTIGVGWRTG